MSSSNCTDFLKDLFPGEKFKRRKKIVDELGYTHRCFQSAKRHVVVTTDQDEDEYIGSVANVYGVPHKDQLKDPARPWVPGGPLTGFVFAIDRDPSMGDTISIWWDFRPGVMDDSHTNSEFIELVTDGQCDAESVFEFDKPVNVVRGKLLHLGAKEVTI